MKALANGENLSGLMIGNSLPGSSVSNNLMIEAEVDGIVVSIFKCTNYATRNLT